MFMSAKQEAFAFEKLSVTTGTAVGVTVGTAFPGNAQATYGLFSVETNNVRWRVDGGNPDATDGHLIETAQYFEIHGAENIRNLRMIGSGGTATVQCTYAR
jgi:hypothetical protein